MSNTRKPSKPDPAPAALPDPSTLPNVPSPDELAFDDMWLIKAATGIDVLDPPIRGLAVAACLWFACKDLPDPLSWEQAKRYRLDDVEIGTTDLDEGLPRDEAGTIEAEADADPTDGPATPSSA